MAQKYLKLSNILKRLLFDNNMKAVDLSRELNIPAPTIHRLLTGKSTRPHKSSLVPIANYFAVRVKQLIGEEPLSNFNELDKNINTEMGKINYIPMIPWDSFNEIDRIDAGMLEKLSYVGKISDNGCATVIQDSSMEPLFPKNCLLIFDPEKTPKDRSYVLVKMHDSIQVVFRQLLIDVEHKYLKPLNPDLNSFRMRLLKKQDTIIAVLVEARHIYSEI